MNLRSANKVATEKTAAVSGAMPQGAKGKRKESPNAPDKRRAAASRSAEPKLARHKRVALLVITFIKISLLPQS
jgi:hypothetical protein